MFTMLVTCFLILLSSSPTCSTSHPKNLMCSSDGVKRWAWCLPPDYETLEPPVKEDEKMEVEFEFKIEEVREISDVHETIQIEMFLERKWIDNRIQTNPENPHWSRTGELPISLSVLDNLWKPSITIQKLVNFKKHVVIEDLAGLIINKNKTVKHSIQALITLSCPMNFKMFPFDSHSFNFMIRSYNHHLDKMTCNSIKHYDEKAEKIILQFNVKIADLDVDDRIITDENGKFAACGFVVKMKRKLSTIFYQVYLPLYLFVIVSWVSFIIPPDIIPGRFGGLIVLFLIVVNTFNSTKIQTNMTSDLNKLDSFSIACIFFIFFAILEYTWILIIIARSTRTRSNQPTVMVMTVGNVSEAVQEITSAPGFLKKLSVALNKTVLIDAIASIVFPSAFVIFNLFYWFYMINDNNGHLVK